VEITEGQYKNFKQSVVNKIVLVMDDNPDQYFDAGHAFDYFSYCLFSDANESAFVLTDGANDQGIDFFTETDNNYEIFQCKFPDIDQIEKGNSPISFDKSGIDDLKNAYSYLTSQKGISTANNKVKDLRSQILSQTPESISYNLCIFGYLTDPAKQSFQQFADQLPVGDNVSVNLYTYEDIILNLIGHQSAKDKADHEFKVFDGKSLTANDYCYFITYAKEFRDVLLKYGWSIFDYNVRSEISKSRVNKQIVESIKKDKYRKRFHHLNNGILILCNHFSVKKLKIGNEYKTESINIHDLQIINGCQTVVSINKGFKELNDKNKIDDFNSKCLVQVKVIQQNKEESEFIDQLIISTNTQNPMAPRNLRSNTVEQKEIAAMFSLLPSKWFYQRKDGEYEFKKYGPKTGVTFHAADYKGLNAPRVIDNEDLAKSWICFIGQSYDAMMTTDFFKEDELYNRIFKYYPTNQLWKEITDHEIEYKYDKKQADKYFEVGKKPSAEEYLIAYIIWRFVKEFAVKPTANRNQALERGRKKGKIVYSIDGKPVSSQEDQAKYLASDTEYMINNIINNLKEEMVEMFSFVIAIKYGHGVGVANKLLGLECFKSFITNPNMKDYIQFMPRSKENILYCIYEFLKYTLSNLYPEIKSEYAAASRRKSYLADTTFIQKFKKKIVELNSEGNIEEIAKDWKTHGKNFYDSMPSCD